MSHFMKLAGLLVLLMLVSIGLSNLSGNSCDTGSTCGSSCPPLTGGVPGKSGSTVGGQSETVTGLPRLVDLGSTTCGPCQMMAVVLDDLSANYKGKLSVEFIDINEDSEGAAPYKIRVIPTQVFIDASGKEFFRHEGYYPKEDILAKFKEHGIDLTQKK